MARGTRMTKRAKKTLRIPDLSGVEGRVVVPEGNYSVIVSEVEENDGSQAPYFKWVFEITEGEYKGKKLFYNTSLAPQALWNLRSLLETLGVEIEDDEMELDLDDLVGRELNVSVEHDTYEGKKQAKVVDFSPAKESSDNDDDGDEEEEEEDKPTRKPKDDKAARRAERRKARKAAKAKQEDDEDEEEEDERPQRNKKKKSLISRDDILDMSQDELEDVVSEYDLEVELDDYPSLRKKKNAVIDALEDAGVL